MFETRDSRRQKSKRRPSVVKKSSGNNIVNLIMKPGSLNTTDDNDRNSMKYSYKEAEGAQNYKYGPVNSKHRHVKSEKGVLPEYHKSNYQEPDDGYVYYQMTTEAQSGGGYSPPVYSHRQHVGIISNSIISPLSSSNMQNTQKYNSMKSSLISANQINARTQMDPNTPGEKSNIQKKYAQKNEHPFEYDEDQEIQEKHSVPEKMPTLKSVLPGGKLNSKPRIITGILRNSLKSPKRSQLSYKQSPTRPRFKIRNPMISPQKSRKECPSMNEDAQSEESIYENKQAEKNEINESLIQNIEPQESYNYITTDQTLPMQFEEEIKNTPPKNLTHQWDISDQKIAERMKSTGDSSTIDQFDNKKDDCPEIDFITDDPKIFHSSSKYNYSSPNCYNQFEQEYDYNTENQKDLQRQLVNNPYYQICDDHLNEPVYEKQNKTQLKSKNRLSTRIDQKRSPSPSPRRKRQSKNQNTQKNQIETKQKQLQQDWEFEQHYDQKQQSPTRKKSPKKKSKSPSKSRKKKQYNTELPSHVEMKPYTPQKNKSMFKQANKSFKQTNMKSSLKASQIDQMGKQTYQNQGQPQFKDRRKKNHSTIEFEDYQPLIIDEDDTYQQVFPRKGPLKPSLKSNRQKIEQELSMCEESEESQSSIERKLECVIRVTLLGQPEPVPIPVYEGDQAKELCAQFCIEHDVNDRTKQINLQYVIQRQIDKHRIPELAIQYSPQPIMAKNKVLKSQKQKPKVKKNTSQMTDQDTRLSNLNLDIKLRVIKLLKAVRLNYDEERGEIGKTRYKQIMKLLKYKEDIAELCDYLEQDPFSDTELENAFDDEYQIKQNGRRNNSNGKIDHTSVMLICYDIYADLLEQAQMKVQEQQDLDE